MPLPSIQTSLCFLRRRREDVGLSQEALAAQVNLHRNYIGLLERGQRMPSILVVQRLAVVLDTTMSELLAGWNKNKIDYQWESGNCVPAGLSVSAAVPSTGDEFRCRCCEGRLLGLVFGQPFLCLRQEDVMSTCRIVTFAGIALLASMFGICGADEKDEAGLRGRWVTKKFVWSGRESGKDEEMGLVIDKETVSWSYVKRTGNSAKSSTINFKYKSDPSKKPTEINLIPSEGPLKGKVFPSIYELDGNTLKLCRAQPGQRRPTEFSSKKGSDDILLILKRPDSPEPKKGSNK